MSTNGYPDHSFGFDSHMNRNGGAWVYVPGFPGPGGNSLPARRQESDDDFDWFGSSPSNKSSKQEQRAKHPAAIRQRLGKLTRRALMGTGIAALATATVYAGYNKAEAALPWNADKEICVDSKSQAIKYCMPLNAEAVQFAHNETDTSQVDNSKLIITTFLKESESADLVPKGIEVTLNQSQCQEDSKAMHKTVIDRAEEFGRANPEVSMVDIQTKELNFTTPAGLGTVKCSNE